MLTQLWHATSQRSLVTQIIFSFVALIITTTLAAGLPAVLLIRSQSQNQAWAQVDQGLQATKALFQAQQTQVERLALLTVQRPSLPALMSQENSAELNDFLQTLQEGTELDLLIICNADRQMAAIVGDVNVGNLCVIPDPTGYFIASHPTVNPLWLLAAESIEVDQNDEPGFVIVGIALDAKFANEMNNETGLDHMLRIEDKLVASSLPLEATRRVVQEVDADISSQSTRLTFALNGRPYYAARLNLGESGIVDEVALEVTDITVTQQRLMAIIAGSVILVAVVGSILGIVLARRISRPLSQLTQAATALSTGDLDTAVAIQSQVKEVTMVAQALEKSRTDLQNTLNELRQGNAWNDHILQSISEGIVVLDEHGRISYFSPSAERISGYSQEEALRQNGDELLLLAETNESFTHFLPQPGHSYKVTLVREDGRLITVAITGANLSLPSIGKTGVALVLRDITDTERIHHLLGQFLANITHEFRTPLTALAASTELLMDQATDLTAAELQELSNSLHLGILGLQTLIDNLLESASLEAGRFRVYPRATDITSIIVEAAKIMKPLQDKYGQKVLLDLSTSVPQVQADPRRTTQVVMNLLSNAIKYSPDGAEIGISTNHVAGYVRVSIADKGPGVPPGYRPNLFRRLVHPGLESSKSQYGVGLGLSVVKAIVEAQGGQVGIEDREGGGSLFWFTIPEVGE